MEPGDVGSGSSSRHDPQVSSARPVRRWEAVLVDLADVLPVLVPAEVLGFVYAALAEVAVPAPSTFIHPANVRTVPAPEDNLAIVVGGWRRLRGDPGCGPPAGRARACSGCWRGRRQRWRRGVCWGRRPGGHGRVLRQHEGSAGVDRNGPVLEQQAGGGGERGGGQPRAPEGRRTRGENSAMASHSGATPDQACENRCLRGV